TYVLHARFFPLSPLPPVVTFPNRQDRIFVPQRPLQSSPGARTRHSMPMLPSLLRTVSFSRRHWFVLRLCLFFAAVSVQYSLKAMKGGSAFVRWQAQLQHLDEGDDIIKTYQYPNPPIMALLLKPLADLPPVTGALIWFYLKVGMTLLAFVW